MCEGEISIEQLSESLDLFICLWGLFGFFCPFFHFPSRADWIILSTGSRISVGSLRRICSPRTDGLEERMWEERRVGEQRRGEERERYELVNVQTSLGSGGVHIVDSFACNNHSHISCHRISCFGGCVMYNTSLCNPSNPHWWCTSRGK